MTSPPPLTIIAMPKPFRGHIGIIQRNAITSWARLQPRPEIILFGTEEGAEECAADLGLVHIPEVARNRHGTPLLADIFAQAEKRAAHDTLAYVNADIILHSSFTVGVEKARQAFSDFLAVGRRTNLNVREPIDFSNGWEAELQERTRREGQLESHTGIDFFVFLRGAYRDVPPLAIGRVWFDQWCIKYARKKGLPVIDLTPFVPIVHQLHDYNHVAGGKQCVYGGAEADENLVFYGEKPHTYTILSATHELTPGGQLRRLFFREETAGLRRVFWTILVEKTFSLRKRLGLSREGVREGIDILTMSADSEPARAVSARPSSAAFPGSAKRATAGVCPACGGTAGPQAVEQFGRYSLLACAGCDLHFWEPREMPDARWYEQMYGGRDEKLLPLEPGHKYFLSDPLCPGRGDLLDIGCGTGNFLAAARDAGYTVSGTELDRNAAHFAKEQLGLTRVLGLTISEFAARYPNDKFDVVTFFEVLEHQAAPVEFIEKVKSCLRPSGYIALSVPNRERWLTGTDVLDYPPNHFLRWSVGALRHLLIAHGFEILSVKQQPAGLGHTAQMINMRLRTGFSQKVGGVTQASFRDVMQMTSEQASVALETAPTMRQRAVRFLGRIKHAACFPVAAAVYPYVRMHGYKGTYLYFLARLMQ